MQELTNVNRFSGTIRLHTDLFVSRKQQNSVTLNPKNNDVVLDRIGLIRRCILHLSF